MHPLAPRLGALTLLWLSCARASAHGFPPDPYAILSRDTVGPRAVSTSSGLALRRPGQRYQFVCPALWGDQFSAPVAALADGTIVLAAASGLQLLGEDGSMRPHPDPAAAGLTSDLVRTARGVFALRATPLGSELLEVDAQKVRVLWKDGKSEYSMTALDDRLVLLRESGRMLEQIVLSAADGAELERQLAPIDLPVDDVIARGNAGVVYAYLLYRNGSAGLGSLHMNGFTKLAEAEVSIAGPLDVGGVTLLAIDGKLQQLIEGRATPLPDDHTVVGLVQDDGLSYACERNGITRLNGPALAEPLFLFSWLTPPDLTQVPEGEARMLCAKQWADLLSDLLLTSIVPLEPSLPAAAAGSGALQLPVGAPAAGAVAATPAAPAPPAAKSGCAVLPGRHSSGAAAGYALTLGLALAWMRRRLR